MESIRFSQRDKASPAALRKLSDRAFAAYAAFDPVEVYFRDGKYYLRGVLEADEMTFEEMDKFLSDVADALGR